MSLHNDLSALNNTIEKKTTQKERKELEKIRNKKAMILLKRQLQEAFTKVKNQNDIEILTTNLIKNKAQNIDFIKELYFEKYEKKLQNNNIYFLEENYLQAVLKLKKEYMLIYKEEERQQKELEKLEIKQQQEEERKRLEKEYQKQAILQGIQKTCYIIILICIIPFVLVFAFVGGMLKNTK